MKVHDFSSTIPAVAVLATITSVSESTTAVEIFLAVTTPQLALAASPFSRADPTRRVKGGKLTPDKAAEEVEKLKGGLKK